MVIAYCARTLVDGVTDRAQSGAALLVEDGRILGVRPAAGLPAGSQVVDFGDRTIVPGLIDCHVHIHWNGTPDPQAITMRESRRGSTSIDNRWAPCYPHY